jgi:hypothetical protein
MFDLGPFLYKNMIVQADYDSGDSSQRMGTFWAMGRLAQNSTETLEVDISQSYETSMKAHEVSPGVYRRSNDETHWGYNPNNFSRDQWSILQLSWAINKDKKRLKESMIALAKRGFVHQNIHPGTDASPNFRKFPDIAHPSHFSVFIRGMDLWYFLPLLSILDITLLGDLFTRKSSWDYDNMMAQHILYANIKYPTFASKIAMFFYLKTDFMQKIEVYHSLQNNGIPPLVELFKQAYNNFRRQK